jgi:nucleoside-diphosphate-sugar epimerase
VFVFGRGKFVTRILVTGASGFIGRALVAELANAGHSVRAAMRQPADIFPRSVEVIAVSDLTRPVEWRPLLRDIETVVHLAGIAYAEPEIAEQAYDRVNRLATAELASAAKTNGIGHLIFMSSIRAQSGPASNRVLRETDAPLPLGLCHNRRSLLARRNLIDAIHLALASSATKGETYVVADPTPLTLTEIVTALREGEGRRPGLLPVPPALIALASRALGRAEEWQRLGGTLVADPAKLLHAGWKPAPDTPAGLAALVRAIASGNAS